MKALRGAGWLACSWLACACGAFDAKPGPAQPARLLVHAATDASAFVTVIEDFEQLSGIEVEHVQMSSKELYEDARIASGATRPDLLISSAMDLQAKLVNDGFALEHEQAETWLPAWARWRNEAFGFTREPAVLAYNTHLLAGSDVPHTRAALLALLRDPSRPLRHRIGTYDIRQSGLGYLLATQDARLTPLSAALATAMGDNDIFLAAETRTLLQRVASGELALAYNVLGSYAQARIDAGDPVQLIQLEDYTLVVARVALIPKSAPHAAQARRLLDYLMSQRGQRTLAKSGLPPLAGERAPTRDTSALRPVPLGPGLLVYRDAHKRNAFLEAWTNAIHPATTGF